MAKQGFFNIEGMETYGDCSSCKLYKKCKSPQMDVVGEGKERVMLIGEFPGSTEDDKGDPLAGKFGYNLSKYFDVTDLKLERDCWFLNAVNCRPPGGRKPTNTEINCCRKFVIDRIRKYNPVSVILLGKTAVTSVIGYSWVKKLGGLDRWVGFQIPDKNLGTWICPTFNPNFVSRVDNSVLNRMFKNHLSEAGEIWNLGLPKEKDNAKTIALYDDDIAAEQLSGLFGEPFAFDYETNAIKPERDGADIISVSFCNDWDVAYAFELNRDYENNPASRIFIKLLQDPNTPKIAHNVKFEDRWTKGILGTTINGWHKDTMMGAHCEDNRKGITSLKFQTYVKFGITGYDTEIEPYMKEGAGGLNRLHEFPMSKLLKYNALDSLYTYRLYCMRNL